MIVCDDCKKSGKVHQNISFGFPYYEKVLAKNTEVMAFFGIHGDFCESCIKKSLKKLGYEHSKPKMQLSDYEREHNK